MKANEFRIGNFINLKDWKDEIDEFVFNFDIDQKQYDNIKFKGDGFAKILNISDSEIELEAYSAELDYYSYDEIKPIPITEQWLTDFGFEKEPLSDDSVHYQILKLNNDKHCDLCLSSGDKKGFLEVTLFPYEDWFRFRYVHQLQNIYFSLTGEELELNNQ